MLIFSACGKKDKESNALVGNWKGDKSIETEYINGQFSGSDTTVLTSPDYFNLTFKSNNNFELDSKIHGDTEHESGYYSISGNQLSLGATEADPDKDVYTFQLNGNSLIMNSTDTTVNNNIIYNVESIIYLTKQ